MQQQQQLRECACSLLPTTMDQMRASSGRGHCKSPSLSVGRGAAAFTVNSKAPACRNNNLSSYRHAPARPLGRTLPARPADAATQDVGSTTLGTAMPRDPPRGRSFCEIAAGSRSRRIRARGGGGLRMAAEPGLVTPREAMTTVVDRVAACGPNGEGAKRAIRACCTAV